MQTYKDYSFDIKETVAGYFVVAVQNGREEDVQDLEERVILDVLSSGIRKC